MRYTNHPISAHEARIRLRDDRVPGSGGQGSCWVGNGAANSNPCGYDTRGNFLKGLVTHAGRRWNQVSAVNEPNLITLASYFWVI